MAPVVRSTFKIYGFNLTKQSFSVSGQLPSFPAPAVFTPDWSCTLQLPTVSSKWAKYKTIQWPRITVVTPSYNQGKFLEATIRSVLLQNYPNLEYIIIDGGSTDESRTIIQKYEQFLAYWESTPDRGQADAINKGFAHASGDVLGWLNSDDLLFPDALWHIGLAFAENADTKAVYGFRKIINAEGQITRTRIDWWPNADALKYENLIPQETVYWRRDVWEKIGPLNIDFHFGMDYEYFQRILSVGYKFTRLPYFLGAFRRHADSKTSTQIDTMRRDFDKIYQKYLGRTMTEQDIYQVLGPDYSTIKQLVKDLDYTILFRSRYLVVIILSMLSQPILAKIILMFYRLYRAIRKK
jgi:glycosyltransferase involved in cell wall biosynthesis